MAREMIDSYQGFQRQDVIVDVPVPFKHAGSWHGVIRARLVDRESDEWWFEVGYSTGVGENRIGTFPVDWCRRPELDDFIGLIPPNALERMRAAEAASP